MRLPTLLSLLFSLTVPIVSGFITLSTSFNRHPQVAITSSFANPRTTTARYATDDEIAKLEAQLKQLKKEKESEEEQPPLSSEFLERADMMLSERDLLSGGIVKDAETNSSDGSFNVLSIVAGIAGLVAILLFAQIPVGQDDLARYSPSAGPKNAATATSIDLGDLNPSKP